MHMKLGKSFLSLLITTLILSNHQFTYADSTKLPTKFFVYSAPKTGSHLLNKAIELLSSKKVCMSLEHEQISESIKLNNYINRYSQSNKIVHTHRIPPAHVFDFLHLNDVKMITIIRDPRDHLISLIYHHHRCKTYQENPIVTLPNPEEPLTEDDVKYLLDLILIYNIWPYKSYHHVINDIFGLQYLNKEKTLVVKFENLIGPKGGGTEEDQIECLTNICAFLEIPYTTTKINDVIENLFGGTWSFRKGQIGEWKKYFSVEHEIAFQNPYRYRNLLRDFEYE